MKDDDKSGRKLTVAHFMPWSGMGGVEIATLRMTEITRDQVHNVAFCPHDATVLIDAFRKLGIETILYTPPEPSLRHAVRYFKASFVVARKIRRAEADIVHFAEEKAAYHNSLAAVLARSRIVCHFRVSNPHLSLRQRLCLLPVQSFVFVSKEARKSFSIALTHSRARVIYDAIEVSTRDMTESRADIRRELGIPAECTVVGMVARVNPQKDYYTLASAAAEVLRKHPNTRFLIVGDNSLVDVNRHHYAEVVHRLDDLGVAGNFVFTGHRDDVPRVIAAMDICVLCTHREGFPLSILESMAMSKPVVATAVGGIPEIVIPGVNGYLHQHEDSKELAGAIMSLIESPECTARLGQAAYEHVRQNYSRQVFATEILKAYRDVMPQ